MTKAEQKELKAAGVNVKLARQYFNSRFGDYDRYYARKAGGNGWKAQSKRASQYYRA